MQTRCYLCALVIAGAAAAWGRAAPQVTDEARTEAALEQKLTDRLKEIQTLSLRSQRARLALAAAGFPSDDLLADLPIEQKLDCLLLPYELHSVKLVDALRALARNAKIGIRVDWRALESIGVSQETPISCDWCNASVAIALREVLGAAGNERDLTYQLDERGIYITTANAAQQRSLTRTYDVAPVLARVGNNQEAADMLQRLITETVAPDSWRDAGGDVGVIEIAAGQMRIRQTPEELSAVDDLLDRLDAVRHAASLRRKIQEQDAELAALTREAARMTTRCQSLGVHLPPQALAPAGTLLPDLRFDDVPLERCIRTLELASQTHIHVNWRALNSVNVETQTPIWLNLHGQTLDQALRALTDRLGRQLGVGFAREPGQFVFSTADDLVRFVETKVYDIRPLLRGGRARDDDINALAKIVEDLIAPDTWRDAGGSTGMFRDFGGLLVVVQTPENHAALRTLLEQLAQRPAASAHDQPLEGVLVKEEERDQHELIECRVYDLRALLPGIANQSAAVEWLRAAIVRYIEPDSWRDAGGTDGAIYSFNGFLVVGQTPRAQARIREVVAHLQQQLQR